MDVISAKNSHNIGRLWPSHSYEPYERRANRLAAKYFSKNYGVNWFSPYPNSNSTWTIADYYPLCNMKKISCLRLREDFRG